VFRGDYVGNLADQLLDAAEQASIPTTGAGGATGRRPAHIPAQTEDEVYVSHLREEGWGGHLPVAVTSQQQPGLISRATAPAPQGDPGWKDVGIHKGWRVQRFESYLQPPVYRGVWEDEATAPQRDPAATHRDIDATADAPRVDYTRNLPPDAPAADQAAWQTKLETGRRNWGPAGHVQTYKGVKIFRGKRNEGGPNGEKVTVPVYYTKDKLVTSGVQGLGAVPPAEAMTLEEIQRLVDGTGTQATGEAAGKAAATTPVEALPGEGGTRPQVTWYTDPRTATVAMVGTLAVGAGAWWWLKKRRG
jgi:hypothetical protein